jgi:uncharacterized protein
MWHRCALVLLACWAGVLAAQAPGTAEPLRARVTDLTGTLTAQQQARLESQLATFEARKGAQVAVLLVLTTQPETIEQYSMRVVERSELGRKKSDDGVLLLIAKQDRRMRIEVGYGLEGALTDALSKRIIAETITPLFRQGDFFAGIEAGVTQIIQVIDGEPLPPPDPRWRTPAPSLGQLLPILFAVVFVGATVLGALFGRGFGSVLTGALAGVVVWGALKLFAVAMLAALAAAVIAGFIGGSGRGWSSHARHGGWAGGWGDFGGRGGGFGGGFGGGGGGFGGGGASGGW